MRMHAMSRVLCGGLMVAGGLAAADVQAQDFRLGAGFTPDPQTGAGWTGGPGQAARFGAHCLGAIAEQPDHRITVTSAVNLRLDVDSTTDSTLVVVGPAGVFCDDDGGDGLNARVDAQLTPGEYAVYVGHHGSGAQYRLAITERIAGVGSASGNGDQGRYGSFRLGAGFTPDPQTATGRTGGGVQASQQYGAHCAGVINDSPDHRLVVTSRVSLRIAVESGVDSTLVITGPGKVVCDDDSNGRMDARIIDTFHPGEYSIYVGQIGTGGDYVLSITESFDR